MKKKHVVAVVLAVCGMWLASDVAARTIVFSCDPSPVNADTFQVRNVSAGYLKTSPTMRPHDPASLTFLWEVPEPLAAATGWEVGFVASGGVYFPFDPMTTAAATVTRTTGFAVTQFYTPPEPLTPEEQLIEDCKQAALYGMFVQFGAEIASLIFLSARLAKQSGDGWLS